MTPSTPPTLPFAAAAHNAPPPRVPRREEVEPHTVGVLQKGGPGKADLLLVDLGEGTMVVKDFYRKSSWTRLLGRIQVGREYRAYRWIGPMQGVPALIGRVDAHALALERVEGEQLAFAPDRLRNGEQFVARLRELLDRLHARGVVHHDLRGRENLLVRPSGDLVLVDLAGAIWFRPGSLAHRWFHPLLVLTDEAAFLKWKAMLTPGRFTEREERFMRRFRFWRSLWLFNRKRRAGAGR